MMLDEYGLDLFVKKKTSIFQIYEYESGMIQCDHLERCQKCLNLDLIQQMGKKICQLFIEIRTFCVFGSEKQNPTFDNFDTSDLFKTKNEVFAPKIPHSI